MTNSMTAFAREELQGDLGRLSWEMRTVNHRYQEISMRLPEELRSAEPIFREAIAKVIHRGRTDAVLHYQSLPTNTSDNCLDLVVVERLAEWERQVRGAILDVAPLRTVDILRWPGVLSTAGIDSDSLLEEALVLLQQALTTLLENRRREGLKLAAILGECVAKARIIVDQVLANWPAVEAQIRTRLEDRIATLVEKLEPGRLEQELLLLLGRADIREEIDRLLLHLEETERVLAGEGPVGRRLDFLMQELNREANTLGSKSSHPIMTAASVDLKVLIEQMREQIQNLE